VVCAYALTPANFTCIIKDPGDAGDQQLPFLETESGLKKPDWMSRTVLNGELDIPGPGKTGLPRVVSFYDAEGPRVLQSGANGAQSFGTNCIVVIGLKDEGMTLPMR
jgi:hypothetical protein